MRTWTRGVLLVLLLLGGVWAQTPAPGDFRLVYEYDSGQRIPHPYRFRVTIEKAAGTFTRWDASGQQVRETPFPVKPEDLDAIYRTAMDTKYFGLIGGVPAAMLDSPSQWVELTADHRSLTVWAQASGNRAPAPLEAIAGQVRAMLQQRVYDWQSIPGTPSSPLELPFKPLDVDAQKGEAGFIHLGDPPEAVEAVWGKGSGAVSAHRNQSGFVDYYDPGEPNNSLVTVVYADGRAGEIRFNLLSPSGRILRGSLDVAAAADRHVRVDASSSEHDVVKALGHAGVDTVSKDPNRSGFLEFGRLAFYFYEGRLRYVRLAGTMDNFASALPGDMPSDLQVTWWRRASRSELETGSLYGATLHISATGGYRTQVSKSGHIDTEQFAVDATELRSLYRLLQHAGFFTWSANYPSTMPDTPLSVLEGDEGLMVWSKLGVYRVDVLGIKGHETMPAALPQIFKVATRLGKGHVLLPVH